MSLIARIIFLSLTGAFSGAIVWPIVELVLIHQSSFSTLFLFNIVLGICVGAALGGGFGSSEGIISKSKKKTYSGVIAGIIIGSAGGISGFLAGQMALLFIGTKLFHSTVVYQEIGFPLSRALGWAVFGLFTGTTEGIRSRSWLKIRNGIVGGFIGGFVGGLSVEYLVHTSPSFSFTRISGFIILGFFIGTFYGIVENRLASASLQLLSGPLKNREFLITQKVTRIGEDELTEIHLPGYEGVDATHAKIVKKEEDFLLTDISSHKSILLNDEKTITKKLEHGDIIQIGNAKFRFKKR